MGEKQSFGKWLRHRRRELDLTQDELAQKAGCAPITIRKLEGDQMRPSKQLAESLGAALGIPLNQQEEFVRFARSEPKVDSPGHAISVNDHASIGETTSHPPIIPDTDFPSGIVNLLFSDMGWSSQLVQRLGENYIPVLEEHQRILRTAFRKWRGYEVNTQGDSFFVVFSLAVDAVAAAMEAQHALTTEQWPNGVRLQVRMGIHTGEPMLVNMNYVGEDVHRAVRICAAAHPGQVLLSDETRVMVERHLPDGASLRDLGKYQLRDLNEPEHLHQLVIRDLPSVFPRLNSLEVTPNNLPGQLTSFIGREREITDIKRLVSGSRLVTLTGAGGTGKTRLAIEVAGQVLDQFPDGAWLIDFVACREPSLVEQAIASAIGIREEPKRPLMQTLTDYLRSKNLLFLFDNCEHLISTCAQVAGSLLQTCPQLSILTTSREALGIAGENQYYVPTLTLPEADTGLSEENLKKSEAARVFLDRVTLVLPTFKLTSANSSAVAQICRRLDGIPLAIELAAARVKSLNVEQIAARLDDRFGLLNTGNRSALPRHQTLRATIDWSYNLLSDEERTLFCRLSVFTGGWTLEAADDVCLVVGSKAGNALNLLLNLADKSLVIVDRQDGETRYRLLETIREYALEKLHESGEMEKVQNRHVDYFINLAERAKMNYRGKGQLYWFGLMEKERDNYRSAANYVLRSNQVETSLHLIGAAFWLWFFRGPWSEGQVWAESALAQSTDKHTVDMASLLMALGLFNFVQSNRSAAQTALEKSLVIWRELEDKWWSAFVLDFLGMTIRMKNQQAASDFFQESLTLAGETHENWILAFSLWNIGENELYLKNIAKAERWLNESLELSQTMGDMMLQTEALRALGEISEAKQEYAQAAILYKESLALVHELHDITNISVLYFNLGRATQLAGDNEKAELHFKESTEWGLRLGKKVGVLRGLSGLGIVAAAQGDAFRAVRLLAFIRGLSVKLGFKTFLNPYQEEWYERHLKMAYSQLGEDKFKSVWADGQRMTLEQAVSLGLQENQKM